MTFTIRCSSASTENCGPERGGSKCSLKPSRCSPGRPRRWLTTSRYSRMRGRCPRLVPTLRSIEVAGLLRAEQGLPTRPSMTVGGFTTLVGTQSNAEAQCGNAPGHSCAEKREQTYCSLRTARSYSLALLVLESTSISVCVAALAPPRYHLITVPYTAPEGRASCVSHLTSHCN